MVLDNYVTFVEGRPKRLHLTDHSIAIKTIRDPVIQLDKPVATLTFVVDEEDGLRSQKIWSITAQGLAAQLSGYLPDRTYQRYDFVVTKRGAEFGIRYSVEAIPRPF
jgi:hypothetical protein